MRPNVAWSAVLGIATGLLWAPCAGPVLGLILTGAALQGAGVGTTLLRSATPQVRLHPLPSRCWSAARLETGGRIVYRFHARDLHLVLGPGKDGKPVRYKLTIDGAAPGPDHGVDTMPDGTGTVSSQRLYQLVRQKGSIADHTFAIEFLDAGVQAFAFTFG